MERHVKRLGILYIVFGGLGFAFAEYTGISAVFFYPFVSPIGTIVVLAMIAPPIIAGIGLRYFKAWARVLTIILSVIYVFIVPIGTALGIYGLWVLLQREAKLLFRRAGMQ